jgi:hypothetical protein
MPGKSLRKARFDPAGLYQLYPNVEWEKFVVERLAQTFHANLSVSSTTAY